MIESKAEEQNMSEKPKRRLVTWEQYLQNAYEKGIAYSLAYIFLGSGLTLLFLSLALLWIGYCLCEHNWEGTLYVVVGVLLASIGSLVVWGAYTLSVKARKIARVELITRHNAGDLPAVATLVRASDLPPSHQQTELLRAAVPAQETPPEELLRASVTSGSVREAGHE